MFVFDPGPNLFLRLYFVDNGDLFRSFKNWLWFSCPFSSFIFWSNPFYPDKVVVIITNGIFLKKSSKSIVLPSSNLFVAILIWDPWQIQRTKFQYFVVAFWKFFVNFFHGRSFWFPWSGSFFRSFRFDDIFNLVLGYKSFWFRNLRK